MGEPITATIPIGQDRLDSHDSAAVALASAPRSISGAASGPGAVSTADDAQISNSEVVLALVKCAIGAGSLSLPYAFKEGGLWFSLIGTVLIGMLSAYTIILLKQCEEAVGLKLLAEGQIDGKGRSISAASGNGGFVKALSPPLLGPEDFNIDPIVNVESLAFNVDPIVPVAPRTKLMYPEVAAGAMDGAVAKSVMKGVVNVGICLTSLGVCAAYLDFLAATLPQVLGPLLGPDFGELEATLMVLPVMLVLVLLRTFKVLSFTAILGDIAVTVALLAVVVYGFATRDIDLSLPFINVKSLMKFVGATSFLFAIHIVVLPILHASKSPQSFAKNISTSFSFITGLNAIFGFLAYALFADDVAPAVTDNLDGGSDATQATLNAVKVLLCVDLLFTVPFVFVAGREIVERGVLSRFRDGERTTSVMHIRNTVRIALLGCVVAICFGVPCFGDMVNLVGGVVNATMGFILPPILALKLFPGMSLFATIGHVLILVFGVTALVLTLFFTAQDLADPSHSC
mmetsp:Transcript_10977/g.25506  ORF Transcript_10977/g.25506 Transcript_10977/m.25506 type:complete len:515 (-) Transcript_10977:83-1627(-)|eukprot:CAMPEP_0182564902 /NCGR_PEP_ID=MMETSP1324-20130603/6747_1 /TAXON_ID=236786 /ORGANISM="Florenciella sp., Strain RCC1587" /LENGTH=514 /DNA_ID=CAMNT_0024778461 /DNA_START=64 /DNA_END=1608 /DNA_ORIENTATION=-